MSVFESSIDYSKVVEHDELDRESENRLELAFRRETDHNNAIMTVAIITDDGLDVTRYHWFASCGRLGRAPLAIYLLIMSSCMLAIALVLERILINKKISPSVQNFLLIMRSIGIFSFIGQVSHLIAWKLMFVNSRAFYCERSRHKVQQDITQCLRRLITCTIFDEIAVRDYIQRINIMNDEARMKNVLDCIKSSDLNDIVADHLAHVYDSAEGPLLDVIGVDKFQLHFHCNYILQQAVCKVLKKFIKEISTEDWRRPETIRNNVVEIVNLQLQNLNWNDITKLIKSVSRRQSDRHALVIFICMAFAGCILEVLHLFLPLH